ncbi:MAG TPA: MOSC domain-containing protein [Sphingorhabdus sp.]|uniref:MOSC domain-containing protein n=1 Tax=Sphingorhabdus sp. TaxID=1902408 RepID=UPI002C3285BB|nr:MOSC domain-containing protein [Sphingorhabdus sp.]HMT40922.1 MOSC domain-containing protein [Sphingorhabdus sp.]HMU22752.1 MOSC domain-containing protein [Sphingorhabdus sp.]
MIKTNIEALLIGKPVSFRGEGEDSSIGSRLSVDHPVYLTFTGFEGDRVGDPTVHGGEDKAVHFYPGEHYPLWEADFAKAGREPHPHLGRLGGFGENISALEMTEDRVQIGDRFRIGEALVEISQGRQPCWKLDHHFGMKGIMAAVVQTGRSGYYFRVMEVGHIKPDDSIEQVERARHGWTVERAFQLLIGGMHRMDGANTALRELAEMETLALHWRWRARQLLESQGEA